MQVGNGLFGLQFRLSGRLPLGAGKIWEQKPGKSARKLSEEFLPEIFRKKQHEKVLKGLRKKSREMSDSQTFVSGESCFEDDHDRPTRGNCQSIYRRTLYHLKAKASLVIFPEAFEVNENNNNFNKVRFESTYFFCMSGKQ